MFFSFQVDGYRLFRPDRVHLSYKMDAFDPHGVRIVEPVAAEIEETLAPEDKNWKPTVRQEIRIPPLADSGTYKIAISLTDEIGNGHRHPGGPFAVRGRIRGAQRHAGHPQYPLLPRRGGPKPCEGRLPARRRCLGALRYHRFQVWRGPTPSRSATAWRCSRPAARCSTRSRRRAPTAASRSIPSAMCPPFSAWPPSPTHAPASTLSLSPHMTAWGNQTFEARQSFTIE
jgi:hypothetical protein